MLKILLDPIINQTIGSSVYINSFLQLCFRISCFFYQFATKPIQNKQNLKLSATVCTKSGNSTLILLHRDSLFSAIYHQKAQWWKFHKFFSFSGRSKIVVMLAGKHQYTNSQCFGPLQMQGIRNKSMWPLSCWQFVYMIQNLFVVDLFAMTRFTRMSTCYPIISWSGWFHRWTFCNGNCCLCHYLPDNRFSCKWWVPNRNTMIMSHESVMWNLRVVTTLSWIQATFLFINIKMKT